jgi:hypothetical protein
MTTVTPFVPRARCAPRRMTVLLFLCLASLAAEIAAGLAVVSVAVKTGLPALPVLAGAGAIAALAIVLAVRDARQERRGPPAIVRTLPVRRLDGDARPPERRFITP